MRILLAAAFNENKNGNPFYTVVRKMMNGFIRNGHAVYPFSDRDIARASNMFLNRKLGVAPANRRLVQVAQNFRPELVCYAHADVIRNATLDRIREVAPGVRIAAVNVDALFIPSNVEKLNRIAGHVDAIFNTTAGEALKQFARPNNVVAFIPNSVDRSIESLECFNASDQQFDMFCAIGGDQPAERSRAARAIEGALAEKGLKPDFRGFDGRRGVFGARYFDAIGNARMGLNLNRRNDQYLYSSDRLAHYTGCGLLTFTDRETRLDELYGEDEMVFYDSPGDAADKAAYYTENDAERRRIAENGHRKAHDCFNERLVTRFIAETTFGEKLTAGYAWPTRAWTVGD